MRASGAIGGFDLGRDDGPQIQVGAFRYAGSGSADVVWAYGNAEAHEATLPPLADRDRTKLPFARLNQAVAGEWVYRERAWRPGQPDDDVTWVLDGLDAACSIWDRSEVRTG